MFFLIDTLYTLFYYVLREEATLIHEAKLKSKSPRSRNHFCVTDLIKV